MNKYDRYNWTSRFLLTQPVAMLVSFADIESNKISLAVMVSITFILMNWIVVKDTVRIFKSTAPLEDLLKEYFWILIYGLLNIFIFASLYYSFGLSYKDSVMSGDWTIATYFSIVTWTTLGYGDFLALPELRLVAAFQALMGYIYMAILMGLLLNLAQHFKTEKS